MPSGWGIGEINAFSLVIERTLMFDYQVFGEKPAKKGRKGEQKCDVMNTNENRAIPQNCKCFNN